MKKIALVTCYFQHNYGSQLQALATQMIFDKLGLKNETICIDGLKAEINKAKYRYFLSKIFDINTIRDKMATVRKQIAKRTNPEYALFLLSLCYTLKIVCIRNNAYSYGVFVVGNTGLRFLKTFFLKSI